MKGRAGNWYVFVLSLGELLTLKTMCLDNFVKNGFLMCTQNLMTNKNIIPCGVFLNFLESNHFEM